MALAGHVRTVRTSLVAEFSINNNNNNKTTRGRLIVIVLEESEDGVRLRVRPKVICKGESEMPREGGSPFQIWTELLTVPPRRRENLVWRGGWLARTRLPQESPTDRTEGQGWLTGYTDQSKGRQRGVFYTARPSRRQKDDIKCNRTTVMMLEAIAQETRPHPAAICSTISYLE